MERLLCCRDPVERALLHDVVAGADRIAARRDERLAELVAHAVWGG